MESIRAGLAFRLTETVGAEAIQELEEGFVRRALDRWRRNPRLLLLGSPDLPRVAIVSFGIRHYLAARPIGMLHPNFVVALFDDLIGIQARSGCFCAGPYVHRLIGLDLETSAVHEAEVGRGHLGMKLGFVRLAPESMLPGYLEQARKIVAEVEASPPASARRTPFVSEEFERLRWFPLPDR